jgi:hypothetical protein
LAVAAHSETGILPVAVGALRFVVAASPAQSPPSEGRALSWPYRRLDPLLGGVKGWVAVLVYRPPPKHLFNYEWSRVAWPGRH